MIKKNNNLIDVSNMPFVTPRTAEKAGLFDNTGMQTAIRLLKNGVEIPGAYGQEHGKNTVWLLKNPESIDFINSGKHRKTPGRKAGKSED